MKIEEVQIGPKTYSTKAKTGTTKVGAIVSHYQPNRVDLYDHEDDTIPFKTYVGYPVIIRYEVEPDEE